MRLFLDKFIQNDGYGKNKDKRKRIHNKDTGLWIMNLDSKIAIDGQAVFHVQSNKLKRIFCNFFSVFATLYRENVLVSMR